MPMVGVGVPAGAAGAADAEAMEPTSGTMTVPTVTETVHNRLATAPTDSVACSTCQHSHNRTMRYAKH